jgi:myo-inositol-1(or 4)-monophosphatase
LRDVSRAGTDAGLDEDETLLAEAVREAGAVALGFFDRGLIGRAKADNTPVSDADLAANDVLHAKLRLARPHYGWLSEETEDDPARLDAERVWIVDPIDGTRAFLQRHSDWAVSVALVENGLPVLGAVFGPVGDELFMARAGRGAFLNGRRIDVADLDRLEGATIITGTDQIRDKPGRLPWPPIERVWVNAITYRLARIASGEVHATFALTGKSEWDLAAATLLVQEAGGRVTDAQGVDLRFNQPNPRINGLVAAGPRLHALLVARTRPEAHKTAI